MDGQSINSITQTSADLATVRTAVAQLSVPGWSGPSRTGDPNEARWTRSYRTTLVTIVGIVLLITTLIGGLLLLMKNTEVVSITIIDEGATRKVIVSGSGDQPMQAEIFRLIASLPRAA